MTETEGVELLRRLTLADGPPGAETGVRALVRQALEGVGRIECDRLGSIVCEKKGRSESPRIQLDSHLDEVGLMVQSISEEGMLGFVALGSWWEHVLLAQRVDILTSRGRVPGVVGSRPPHFLSAEERKHVLGIEKLYIDVGAATRDEASEIGVRVGDPVVPHAEFRPFANPRILSSKAFDNRVGVALMVEALKELGADHPNTVFGVGAVQEEVGCRGAGTAAALVRPDVGLVLEGTPADDTPGMSGGQRQAVLGKGPQLRFFDPTAISNRALLRLVEETAREESIPLQLAVRRSGGTDAKALSIHARGVPTVVLGVPARYIHTHVSLIHLDDYLAAKKLVLAVLRRLDRAALETLVSF
jgi:putative aminopeptidase FrvX